MDPYIREFREYLVRIGGGARTSKDLSRSDMTRAMELVLFRKCSPAQIGAFLIAMRMKRPTPVELCGILDAYDRIAKRPSISLQGPALILGYPYDGRKRWQPILPMVALLLSSVGVFAVTHGGDMLGPKFGWTLDGLWRELGVDWRKMSLASLSDCIERHRIGHYYSWRHFSESEALGAFRDEIGKRPPMATAELMWNPICCPGHLAVGYVHQPTVELIRKSMEHRECSEYTLVKGTEGSCELPIHKAVMVRDVVSDYEISAGDLGLDGGALPMSDISDWKRQCEEFVHARDIGSDFSKAVIYNASYWASRCGAYTGPAAALPDVEKAFRDRIPLQRLDAIRRFTEK